MWNLYASPIRINGTVVAGTDSGPRTARWNLFLLIGFLWRKVIVFKIQAQTAQQGYRIGFRVGNVAKIWSNPCYHYQFRMRIGREDRTFFAVDLAGQREIPLTIVAQAKIGDKRYKHARLY